MAEPVPAGSDVSALTYRYINRGDELSDCTRHLPPCPASQALAGDPYRNDR